MDTLSENGRSPDFFLGPEIDPGESSAWGEMADTTTRGIPSAWTKGNGTAKNHGKKHARSC